MKSGSAVTHDDVQSLLRIDLVTKIFTFQHLALICDHLSDMSRVVTTIFRTIMVDLAHVLTISRIEPQPGASG